MAPARILPREPQHQLPNLHRQARPSALAGRLSPLPANEPLVPAQKRPRSHEEYASRRAGQVARCSRKQGSINHPEFRPRDLPAQDLELVAQHQQLDVFHMQATTATKERTEESAHDEVKERERHAADTYWRPFREISAPALMAKRAGAEAGARP